MKKNLRLMSGELLKGKKTFFKPLRFCLIALLFLICSTAVAKTAAPPPEKISLKLTEVTIDDFLDEIKKKTGLNLLYNAALFKNAPRVSVNVENEKWQSVIKTTLEPLGYTFEVDNDIVIIRKKPTSGNKSVTGSYDIQGIVLDNEGEALIGATVIVRNQRASTGVATGLDGEFNISVAGMNESLIFSYVGMETKEIKLSEGTTFYIVKMLPSKSSELRDVVVEAGIIQRDKLGFTGAYSTVTQKELKSVGNLNLIQSLKTLDPSFIVLDNNLAGSNPNVMANIEVRGQTGMNITSVRDDASINPNTPLFVLDGFEATLQQISDLDVNRVESVTILKDAGSTAIYGAKGANGVIVVETIKPKAGEFMITYNADTQLSWADLSVYNMMNASEKLEYELLANRYGDINNQTNTSGREKYYGNLARVERGVDTYWLKKPVRTAFTHNHSVGISGGDKKLLFAAGVNYKNYEGVMKGSSRETFGGDIKITYRGNDGFRVSNSLTLSAVNAYDGSWGSFSDFVNANPYYEMVLPDGTIPKYLDTYKSNTQNIDASAPNPYYNAKLSSKNDAKDFNVTNNTSVEWFINRDLRVVGNLGLKRINSEVVNFVDPAHTKFDNLDYTRKGTYSSRDAKTWEVSANASVSYNKTLDKVHNLTFIGRASATQKNYRSEKTVAEGFPEGTSGLPSYAYSYEKDSRPTYEETEKREVSFVGAFNYNYKFRYLLDLNYNIDGATTFGSNKRFKNFWSVGLGWNLHREDFAKDWDWLSNLKLRGTYGTNANQQVNAVSRSVYTYLTGNTLFGQSAYLSQYANPNLKWQVVKKLAAGINAGFLDDRLTATFDVFNHKTDPQVVSLRQRASTGIASYPVNMGYLKTKGYEFSVSYSPIYNIELPFILTVRVSGKTEKGEYGGFNDALNNLNNDYLSEENPYLSLNSLLRYEDGRSPNDLWAVKSLGIDPATGKEIFRKKDGTPTFDYDPNDRVVIANSRPDIEGVIRLSTTYRKLEAHFDFRYRLGGYTFNTALYNKVENISGNQIVNNQDKRALYDRWKNPGDISEFKGISLTASTPISSRFIQRDNILRAESIKLSWNFSYDKWITKLRLKDLRMGVSMSDIFTLSSIKVERGTEYPFQRSVAFNLSCRF
ncbi:MAG: SusC/RagA family TonB-linked outer membrane protein [Dysgonomonas sp.]|nr:SusC/RagA family TonB-linked outer membrane protein [Dysgonomonas sp.]